MIVPTPEEIAAELMARHPGWRIWWDHWSPRPERRWWATREGTMTVLSGRTARELEERIIEAERDGRRDELM